MADRENKSPTAQDLADKIKMIIDNPELIARLAEVEENQAGILLVKIEEYISKLEKLYLADE